MEVNLNNPKYKVDYDRWAQIVIEKWEFNIVQKNLIYSGDLLRSFEQTISAEAGGNAALISFAFNYYLRMLEMGVGRGAPIGSESDRKKYKVYTKTLYSEMYRLSELLAEKYAARGAVMIAAGFGDSLTERVN